MKENPKVAANDVKLQTVLISVYYEALCPDSRSFVIKQLEPTFQSLKENVEIQMIPYGKATVGTMQNIERGDSF